MKTILISLMLITPAHAFDMMPNYENAPAKVERVHVVKHQHKPKKVKAKKKKPTREGYSYRSPPPAPVLPDNVTKCLPPVRVVGSQWASDSGAEESARKAWSEEVRFSAGESFMDLETAQNYRRRCTRSSIGELAGQTLHRCEIEAMPCRPGMVEGTK